MSTEGIADLKLDPTWKAGIEWKLDKLVEFAFPALYQDIDWVVPYIPLDAELVQLAPKNERGRLQADKLFRVKLRSGEDAFLFLHLEIQGQRDGQFSFRMWTYNYRICDRFGPNVISLAVLVDEDPGWRPEPYRFEFAGCVRHFEFPVFKLWDCQNPEEVFEKNRNPFGLLVAATQAAWRTRRNMSARSQERMRIVRYLYAGGMKSEDVRTLFKLIAWLTELPKDLELKFKEDLATYERTEKPMKVESLLSPYEVLMIQQSREEGRVEGRQEGLHEGRQEGLHEGRQEGLHEGRQEGLQDSILDILQEKFGALPQATILWVRGLKEETVLRRANKTAATAASLDDFRSQF